MSDKNEKYKVLRVTQLDAEQITNGIYSILTTHVKDSLQTYPFTCLLTVHPEIKTIIRYLIWKYTINKTGISIGQQMLNSQYETIHGNKLNRNQKYIFGMLYVIVEWLKDRQNHIMYFLKYLFSRSNAVSIDRMFKNVNIVISILSFTNFVLFVAKGTHVTIFERILKMHHIYQSKPTPRYIDYEYMRKEMLWENLFQTILTIIPFINYKKLFMNVDQFYIRLFGRKDSMVTYKDFNCRICLEVATNPHVGECGHVFCYFCLKGNILLTPKFVCPQCGSAFEDIHPLEQASSSS